MGYALLAILILTSQVASGVPNSARDPMAFDTIRMLRKSSTPKFTAPSIRACSYHTETVQMTDVARSELHSNSCQLEQSIDNKLPDRPESDIYRVGEPFDVPKR